jgi:prolyl-tRNA synthetase
MTLKEELNKVEESLKELNERKNAILKEMQSSKELSWQDKFELLEQRSDFTTDDYIHEPFHNSYQKFEKICKEKSSCTIIDDVVGLEMNRHQTIDWQFYLDWLELLDGDLSEEVVILKNRGDNRLYYRVTKEEALQEIYDYAMEHKIKSFVCDW